MSLVNKFLLASVLVTSSVTAAVLPATAVQFSHNLKATTTTTETLSTLSLTCDYSWCQNSTSMCVYWAGVTGYDASRGPIPGETITQLGSCAMPTTTDSLEPHVVQNNNKMPVITTPATTVDCSYKYCANSISYCMYWAGVTGFDISLGPIPGMTRTSLGPCQAPTLIDTPAAPHPTATHTLQL